MGGVSESNARCVACSRFQSGQSQDAPPFRSPFSRWREKVDGALVALCTLRPACQTDESGIVVVPCWEGSTALAAPSHPSVTVRAAQP